MKWGLTRLKSKKGEGKGGEGCAFTVERTSGHPLNWGIPLSSTKKLTDIICPLNVIQQYLMFNGGSIYKTTWKTKPNYGTTSRTTCLDGKEQVWGYEKAVQFWPCYICQARASKWGPGGSTRYKCGGQERSAHKHCTFTLTTSYLEGTAQRPGILEKSLTGQQQETSVTAPQPDCYCNIIWAVFSWCSASFG